MDLKTKTRRALDLVVVNRLEKIKNFVKESERNFSPFTPKFINGKVERCFSDHYSIVFDYESGEEIKNDSHVQNKKKIWQYNTKDGNEKFEILTNNLFDWLIQIIEEVDDSESVINLIEKTLEKIKFKSYKVKKFSNDKLNDFCLSEIWNKRLEEMEKLHELLEEENDVNKIFKARQFIEGMNSNETLSAVKDVKIGEVYREADQIFHYLLEYNEENMSKDVIDNEEVRVIRDLKIEAIEMMFEESGDLPQTIPRILQSS